MTEKKTERRSIDETSPLEWALAALGGVIVAAALAFLIYEGIAGDRSAPDIKIEIKESAPVRNGYRVRFEAMNEGGEAAANVIIEGELAKGETSVETSEASIGYLPAHSERGGGLFFNRDPRSFELRVRARGYEDP